MEQTAQTQPQLQPETGNGHAIHATQKETVTQWAERTAGESAPGIVAGMDLRDEAHTTHGGAVIDSGWDAADRQAQARERLDVVEKLRAGTRRERSLTPAREMRMLQTIATVLNAWDSEGHTASLSTAVDLTRELWALRLLNETSRQSVRLGRKKGTTMAKKKAKKKAKKVAKKY